MRPFCSALMTPNLYPELIPMNGPLPCSVPQTTGGDNFTRPSGPGWSRSLPKYSISPTMIVRSCDACIPQAILLSQQLGRNYRLHFLLTIKSRRIWDDLHVLSLSPTLYHDLSKKPDCDWAFLPLCGAWMAERSERRRGRN